MTIEYLDVYDANGKLIGPADRNVVHAYGLWHKTMNCWIVWNNKMVFQRRGMKRAENPGRLYTTATGHIESGESVEEAFARELKQEVGIVPENPRFLGEGAWVADIKKTDGTMYIDRAFSNLFWAEYCGGLEDFKFSDGEVDAVVAIDIDDFLKWSRKAEGEIAGIEWDGKDVRDVKLNANDFLVNIGETIYGKYGRKAEEIKMDAE